jgi:hypothetical protein
MKNIQSVTSNIVVYVIVLLVNEGTLYFGNCTGPLVFS